MVVDCVNNTVPVLALVTLNGKGVVRRREEEACILSERYSALVSRALRAELDTDRGVLEVCGARCPGRRFDAGLDMKLRVLMVPL